MSESNRDDVESNAPEIFNGARCKSYSWSQSHSDLEIRVKLTKPVKYEDVNVVVAKRDICVEVTSDEHQKSRSDQMVVETVDTLVEGRFEHSVDTETACWLIENDEPCIVIYIDKARDLWWKQLLIDEQTTEIGPKSYTVPMDHLDDGSRMVIDKLIIDQRNKYLSKTKDDIDDNDFLA